MAKIKKTVHTKCWQKGGGIRNFTDCYSNQSSTVLAQKTNKHIDQWNRVESPEINPHIWSINLRNNELKQMSQEYKMWEKVSSIIGKTQQPHAKKEIGSLSFTIPSS